MAATASVRRGGLAGAAFIMMASFVASRLTGLLRDVAVSYQFGNGRDVDAYRAAISIPDFVFQVVAGGAVASAFIPVFAGYLARGEEDEGWRMVSTLFSLATVVLSPIIVLLVVFAPDVVGYIAPGLEPAYRAQAGEMARVLMLSPLFFTLGCFTTSVLNSYQRFFLASLAPTVYNLGIIGGALALAPGLGIFGLAVGATLGSLGFLLVQVPGLFQVGMRFRPALDPRLVGVREVGRLMVPRMIGLGAVQVGFLVSVYLASDVPGGIASLNYAWLLTMLPLGVFAMAISTAVFPSLASLTAQNDVPAIRETVSTALRFIIYLTVPASVGLFLLGEDVVRVFFERGQFTAASTAMVAGALRFYAPGLIAMATVEIVTRVFYAYHDTRTPVAVSVGTMLLNALFAVALVGALSYSGLAFASTLASLAEATALLFLVEYRLPGLLDGRLARSFGRDVAGTVPLAAVVLVLVGLFGTPLQSAGFLVRVIVLVCIVGLGAVAYLIATALLGSEEVSLLRGLLRRAIRR